MTLEVTYPHIAAGKEPEPMTAQQVWTVAEQMRQQLMPRPNLPQLDLDRVVRLAGSMKVNGIDIAVHWDRRLCGLPISSNADRCGIAGAG